MKKILGQITLLSAVFSSSVALAAPLTAICKSGSLPESMQGIYSSDSSNGFNTLSKDRWSEFSGTSLSLASCIVAGKRYVTLSDVGEPVVNAVVASIGEKTLEMTYVEDGAVEKLTLVKKLK